MKNKKLIILSGTALILFAASFLIETYFLRQAIAVSTLFFTIEKSFWKKNRKLIEENSLLVSFKELAFCVISFICFFYIFSSESNVWQKIVVAVLLILLFFYMYKPRKKEE